MSRVRFAVGVASIAQDGIVYAALLPDGPLLSLDGGAAIIWRALQDDGDLDTLADRVAASVADVPADLGVQVDAFVETLRAHGLLAEPAS
jgi:hypothetical protein